MNWILKNIFESIANLVDGLFEWVTVAVNNIFLNAANLAEKQSFVSDIENYTAISAVILTSVVIIKRIFGTYIMETDGDPDSDPLDLIMQAAIAIGLISCNSYIFTTLLQTATATGNNVLTYIEDIEIKDAFKSFSYILEGKVNGTMDGLIAVFMLIFAIGTIVLCVKGGIRGAELCLMKILFPLFCCDLLTTRRERFNAFFTSYLVTMFGYILQILCFRFSGRLVAEFSGGESIETILFAFAFLYLAIKAPKWLDKFVYSTGVGQSIGGGARSAAFMAPSIMKNFVK